MYIYMIHLNHKPFELHSLSVSLSASSVHLSLSLPAVNTVESLPNGWHSRGVSGDEQLQQRRDLHIAEEDGKATTQTHRVGDTLLEFHVPVHTLAAVKLFRKYYWLQELALCNHRYSSSVLPPGYSTHMYNSIVQ